MSWTIRAAIQQDVPFLKTMCFAATYPSFCPASLRTRVVPPSLIERLPCITAWWQQWGRHGDVAFVAMEETRPVGAAWYRLFSPQETAYAACIGVELGSVATTIPVCLMHVDDEQQQRGIEHALLATLLAEARQHWRVLSTCVGESEHIQQEHYRRASFLPVRQHEHCLLTMLASLAPTHIHMELLYPERREGQSY